MNKHQYTKKLTGTIQNPVKSLF
uniref:Uncharacterized protein n=1 Tax=Rhizophora mucronata TaxID=61149 RepID=A0A2P2NDZ7_RHIMU